MFARHAAAPFLLAATLALGCGGGDDDEVTPAVAAADGAPALLAGENVRRIYRDSAPGVHFVQATIVEQVPTPFGPQERGGASTGTAFVLDEQGFLLTNAHVVAGARDVALRTGPNELVPVRVVGADLSTDLAVLKADPERLDPRPLPIGDSTAVAVGDPVFALGNPFGLEDTITSGIVSALARRIEAPDTLPIEDAIQTDAAINPGNSGGPLLDAAGRVIGVNSQIAAGPGDQSSAGIGFAIPIDLAKRIVPDLKDDGQVERGFLGVTSVQLTPQLAEQLGTRVAEGVLIVDVQAGSPAARAGLRGADAAPAGTLGAGGDVITAVDGEPVSGPDDLAAAIIDERPGEEVRVEYVRDERERETTVTLAQRDASATAG